MVWPTNAAGTYYVFDGEILIPVDPSTGAAVIQLRPSGGMATVPAIAQGDPGQHAAIDTTINFTALEYDDVTADSASWTELTAPTTSTPGLYQLNLALHKGDPGDDGTTSIDIASISGTAVAGKLIVVNSGLDGFDFQYQKVGARYIPATINSTAASNPNSTLAAISIPARNFDYRVRVYGYTIVTESGGSDVQVDLVARLEGETAGNIIGRCPGMGGTERLTLTPGPPAGSADAYDKVLAGNTATVHLRTEQQSGSNTYTTSATTTMFSVEELPI